VADLRSLDENKLLGFEEKLMGNFSKLLGIRIQSERTRKSCTYLVVRRSDGLVSRCETYLISHISCVYEK
jgi:hypothetical protein